MNEQTMHLRHAFCELVATVIQFCVDPAPQITLFGHFLGRCLMATCVAAQFSAKTVQFFGHLLHLLFKFYKLLGDNADTVVGCMRIVLAFARCMPA